MKCIKMHSVLHIITLSYNMDLKDVDTTVAGKDSPSLDSNNKDGSLEDKDIAKQSDIKLPSLEAYLEVELLTIQGHS